MAGKYVKMLEEEMTASKEFTQYNFGLKVGDSFPELVREIVTSREIQTALMINLVMTGLCGPDVAKAMKEDMSHGVSDLTGPIMKNIHVFETPFAMLYWGIQMGRRIERESAEAMQKLESL